MSMIAEKDKQIVRELAKQYMEKVCSEKQEKMRKRFRDTNDLKPCRPPVILDEIPWYQMNMDGELDCICESEQVRPVELHFRKALFYMKHFKADNHFEPFFRLKRAVDSTGIGVEWKAVDLKRTDSINNIVSREFEDVLADEAALEQMHDPVFTLRPDKDAAQMEFYTELFGDAIPVKLYGFGFFYYAPWDKITRLRGVEPILIDLYDRPEYLHRIMEKFTSAAHAELDFVEKNLDVDLQLPEEELWVRGNEDSIHRVIYNLLDNAVKFAQPNGLLSVAVWKQGGKAYVSIADEGEVIPEDDLPFIFDRFHKSDRSRSLDRDGVGLGLYLVKSILDAHDEDIVVTSKDGVTKFVFSLKLARRPKAMPSAK